MSRMVKQFLVICALVSCFVLPVSAYVEIVEQDDSYFVTDTAKVLDTSTEEYIVSKNQILNETSGASIVIVTVPLLNADITDYAYTIFNEWKLGDAEVNNGILLLISTGDEDYYCMVGRGLESMLTSDQLSDLLYEYLEPDFAAGNIQSGVRKVFDALYQKCVHLYNVDENAQSNVQSSTQIFSSITHVFTIMQTVLMIFVVMTILVAVLASMARSRVTRRSYGPVPPVVISPPRPRRMAAHRPSYPSSHRPVNRTVVHTPSRSSGFGSSAHRSSAPRSSSSFRPRSGGSTRGAGAGRRR